MQLIINEKGKLVEKNNHLFFIRKVSESLMGNIILSVIHPLKIK